MENLSGSYEYELKELHESQGNLSELEVRNIIAFCHRKISEEKKKEKKSFSKGHYIQPPHSA